MIELGLVDVRGEDDVVRAHQTTRTLAAQLGFTTFAQTRIATAMSEIARNALTYAGGGSVTLGLSDDRLTMIIVVVDRGPGIPDLDDVLSGQRRSTTGLGVGIPGTRRLMDEVLIETSPAGTRVELRKLLPRRAAVDLARIGAVQTQLAGQLADDPTQEIRRLQRDVAERDQRIMELTEELVETNRGVMALHEELESRTEYQRQAVELRTRLLSEMGHELRTPLHSITTISQFLLDHMDGTLNSEQDKQVRIIHDVADDLTRYVNDLLDLARTDAGKSIVHLSTFAADAVLKTLRRIMLPLVPARVRLELSAAADVPLLSTDEGKVSQVLRNLVANALKFTERGRVEVRVHALGADRVAFDVRDTGIGIAPEDQELIFREFAQAEGTGHARMLGSGLGLPLSRRLAELLGGTLTMTSEPGQGSTFRFELPARYEGEAVVREAPVVELPPETRPASSEPRVLVIDDDAASRYVLTRWLGDRYRVEQAHNGATGLELAQSHPDAIFLDVVMPDLTGFEVLERLKADAVTRDIPVVVYTALTLGTNDRARLGDAVAILRKSTASRVADRAAIEEALVRAGIAIPVESSHV